MRIIAEILLQLAEREIGSLIHSAYEYVHNLINHLNQHPVLPLNIGGGIRVPAIDIRKNPTPYYIANPNMQGNTQQIALHTRNGSVPHQSLLTACIIARKDAERSLGGHHYYNLELNIHALALILRYIAPHCNTFSVDMPDFIMILQRLVDAAWLNNQTSLTQITMSNLQARETLDQAGYKFIFTAPLDLFLTEKHDDLDQERSLINRTFQAAYTEAKRLHDEAGMLTVKMTEKAHAILNLLRELSESINRAPITPGLHRILDSRIYNLLNKHRIFPDFRSSETGSARNFRIATGFNPTTRTTAVAINALEINVLPTNEVPTTYYRDRNSAVVFQQPPLSIAATTSQTKNPPPYNPDYLSPCSSSN